MTKLDRDPSSGTALQEISFWLNLERALHRIQEKRESLEVSLTLDILKHGKRFHATVSFDTDTGVNVLCYLCFIFVHSCVMHHFIMKRLHAHVLALALSCATHYTCNRTDLFMLLLGQLDP